MKTSTCIVALRSPDGIVTLGADTAGTDERSYVMQVAQSKVFRRGPFMMGYTSSFRMGQMLEYGFDVPTPWPDENAGLDEIDFYMATEFVDAARGHLREGGFTKVENEREEGGQFLVVIHGHIYQVETDFAVLRTAETYAAIGCGAQYALGALRMIMGLRAIREVDTQSAVLEALHTAAHFSAGVRSPFYILREDGNKIPTLHN